MTRKPKTISKISYLPLDSNKYNRLDCDGNKNSRVFKGEKRK